MPLLTGHSHHTGAVYPLPMGSQALFLKNRAWRHKGSSLTEVGTLLRVLPYFMTWQQLNLLVKWAIKHPLAKREHYEHGIQRIGTCGTGGAAEYRCKCAGGCFGGQGGAGVRAGEGEARGSACGWVRRKCESGRRWSRSARPLAAGCMPPHLRHVSCRAFKGFPAIAMEMDHRDSNPLRTRYVYAREQFRSLGAARFLR